MVQNTIDTAPDKSEKPLNPILLFFLCILGLGFQIPFLFPIANSWAWIEAWIYLGNLTAIEIIAFLHLNKHNPKIIRNRIKHKKESVSKASGSDRFIMPILSMIFLLLYIIPALDYRNIWSTVPIWVIIIGNSFVFFGMILIFRTMLENSYASKVLDIRKGHKLIDTGLYARVRHPMYSGFSILCLGITLALGSWFCLPLGIIFIFIIWIRCKYEEKMLIEGLEGYDEYMKRVKYRLFPYLL